MKKLKIFVCTIFLAFALVACSSYEKKQSMFCEVEHGSVYTIVYHRETKVMYAISCGFYNMGTFTVLVNPDGSPMLYEE